MDQRQLEKERIRLTREISMLETQLDAARRGKEDKLTENKQIKEEIEQLEVENKALEEEINRLDEEIARLDEEFKQAQLDAGKLRREIKINIERNETEVKKAQQLRTEIAKLEKNLETLKREVKQEIDDRRNLEVRLRKTNAHIDSMKSHKMASIVTRQLEKQEWYKRQEEPVIMSEDYEIAGEGETTVTQAESVVETPPEPVEEKPSGDGEQGGIDFSTD